MSVSIVNYFLKNPGQNVTIQTQYNYYRVIKMWVFYFNCSKMPLFFVSSIRLSSNLQGKFVSSEIKINSVSARASTEEKEANKDVFVSDLASNPNTPPASRTKRDLRPAHRQSHVLLKTSESIYKYRNAVRRERDRLQVVAVPMPMFPCVRLFPRYAVVTN
jgi:hypothetical protein